MRSPPVFDCLNIFDKKFLKIKGRSPFLIEIFHRKFSIKGQLHFQFKNFSNEGEVPSPKSRSVNAPPLAFPFFAFSLGGEKREKTYGSGNPCRIAVLRQARQAERQQAPTLLSPSGRVARSAERGQPRNIKSLIHYPPFFTAAASVAAVFS